MSIIPRSSMFDFDHFFDSPWVPFRNNDTRHTTFAPRVDVKESKEAYEISAELPGVDKNDITVTLTNGVLSIEAESKQESKEEKDGKIVRQERRYGRYIRSFDLGPQVQESDITANFEDGVLTLKAPKLGQLESTSKRIAIN